jgi:hypothetical protein
MRVPSRQTDFEQFRYVLMDFRHNLARQILTVAIVEDYDDKDSRLAAVRMLRDGPASNTIELFMRLTKGHKPLQIKQYFKPIYDKLEKKQKKIIDFRRTNKYFRTNLELGIFV